MRSLDAVSKILNALPRDGKRIFLIFFDIVSLVFVLWLAYALRLGTTFRPTTIQLGLMAIAPLVAIPVFVRFGLYRAVIRYLPERAIWTILQAMTLATIIWVGILFLAEVTLIGAVPRSVPIFYFLLGTIVVGGARFAAKYLLWAPIRESYPRAEIAIYGAGRAGVELASALRANNSRFVSAFIDDDTGLQGGDVMGIRVYSPGQIDHLVRNVGVREVIVAMPSIEAARRREIVAELSRYPLKIRVLPSISDLAAGKYLVNQLRAIDIDDLLGRSSVPADPALLSRMIENRVILVSGAGGSIGSELCRIIAAWAPKKLVLFEANEFALYQIERALKQRTEIELVPVLGSVEDDSLVRKILGGHAVDVVFHAAAHKHVPLLESNVLEAVRNNVIGTRVIAAAAADLGVENFVLISTDKAVRPTNVMGATKRWAELIVRHYGNRVVEKSNRQRFCAVRFGNVLGSNGSVVPLFSEQIANGGPLTITDATMTRYFMSIHEAAELIVQAGSLSEGGDVFLLDMGEPVNIRDLAENMVRLAGLSVRDALNPRGDIEIVEIGVRPGEKLHEELFYDPSKAEKTGQQKIMRGPGSDRWNVDMEPALIALCDALERQDELAVRTLLFDTIAE